MYSVQPSKENHALHLAKTMRRQDKLEIDASGTDPITALTYPLLQENAQTVTLLYKNEPVLMGGTVGESIGVARLWMLSSDKAFIYPVKLGVLFKKWIDFFHKPYEVLYNYVWNGNDKALNLIKHLNCTVEEELVQRKNLNFVKFIRCKNQQTLL